MAYGAVSAGKTSTPRKTKMVTMKISTTQIHKIRKKDT